MVPISKMSGLANYDYSSYSYKKLIEEHLYILAKDTNNGSITLEPYEADKYTGDLNGLLISKRVDESLRYPVMRLNGYDSYSQYDGQKFDLIVPNPVLIQRIISRYQTISF